MMISPLDSTSNHSTSLDSTSNHSASSFTYGGCVLFPWKLHEMLDCAEERQFTSVVSWLPDCRSFKVHDKETFVSLIMPQFFEQTRYKSFQRQLNMWGFERILEGPEKGGYNHPAQFFVRGESSLCTRMTRLKKKKKNNTNSTTTTSATTTASKKPVAVVVNSNNKSSSSSSSSSSEGIFKGVMRRASRASLVITKALCDQLEAFDRYVSGDNNNNNNMFEDYEQDLKSPDDDYQNDTPPPPHHHHYDDDNNNTNIEPEPYQYNHHDSSGSGGGGVVGPRGLLRRASRASVVITKALHDQLEALDDFMTSSPTTAEEEDPTTEFDLDDIIAATATMSTGQPPMVRCVTSDYGSSNNSRDDNDNDDGDDGDEFANWASNSNSSSVEEFAGQNFFMVEDDEGPELRRLSSIGKRIFIHHSNVSSATVAASS